MVQASSWPPMFWVIHPLMWAYLQGTIPLTGVQSGVAPCPAQAVAVIRMFIGTVKQADKE